MTSFRPLEIATSLAAAGLLLALTACSDSGLSVSGGEAAWTETSHPTSIISSRDEAEMIYIPGGPFSMGAGDQHYDQRPPHMMSVDSFYIDKYEVTNARYKKFVDAKGHPVPYLDETWAQPYNWIDGTYPPGQADHPVVLVNWQDAAAYAEWAGKRLPTEAEWEKAARGTDGRLFPWGDEPDLSRMNTWEQGPGKTMPVGSYPRGASFYGLMDMGGNVWEWVEDWFTRYPGNDWPSDKYGMKYKVARGSSWGNVIKYVRTSNRHWLEPDHKSTLIGFRTASTNQPR